MLLALVVATSMSVELAAWADAGRATAVLVGLVATLPLGLRRRSPLVSFVLVMTGLYLVEVAQPEFANDSMSFVITYVVALYSVGRHALGVEAWVAVAGVVAVMVWFISTDVGLADADLGDIAFVLVFVGAPWAIGVTLRLRREREFLLRAENERVRREQEERAQRAVAEERARIARELHDVVSHAISVTVLQARGARRCLDRDPDAARRALDAIEETNTAALSDMRRLLAVLRDTEQAERRARSPQPSLEHLDALVAQVRSSGVPVTVDVQGRPHAVPPGVDLSAYRIVQESLTNVLKHAQHAQARVTLDYRDDALSISVADDGPLRAGNAVSRQVGHGLIGIRERVAVVGGDVTAGPRPGGGFEVRARLPYSVEVS